MDSSLSATVNAAPFVPFSEQDNQAEEDHSDLLGHAVEQEYYGEFFQSSLFVPRPQLPPNFDENSYRMTKMFEFCVARMPDRMPVYKAFAADVIRAFPAYELGGSAVHGGLTFASDIDLRWRGGESFRAFITRLCAFADEHEMATVAVGKNLCKLIRIDMTVDVLIVPSIARLLQQRGDDGDSPTVRRIMRKLREFQNNETRREIKYDEQKTAMFAGCYDKVMTHTVWRSIAVYLKLHDPKLPTCFVVMMVALAADTIRPVEMAQAWRIALEIIAQFNWRFLRNVCTEEHIAYSFVEEIWRPFHKNRIAALQIDGSFADPIWELFNENQVENIVNSEFLLKELTLNWYPLSEVPVSLGAPRSLDLCVPRVMADFIVLVGYEWEPTRELSIRATSGSLQSFQYCAASVWDNEFMDHHILAYMASELPLTGTACDALEAAIA
jgi:hypothetical protein